MSAQPIPWTTPPCTCPRASVGFRTLPTSCTATKSMTRVAQVRRSTSTSATYAAHANAPYASPRYVLSSHAMPGGFSYAASPNSGSPGCSRCHRRMACFTVPPRGPARHAQPRLERAPPTAREPRAVIERGEPRAPPQRGVGRVERGVLRLLLPVAGQLERALQDREAVGAIADRLAGGGRLAVSEQDRKSTRLNSSHGYIS